MADYSYSVQRETLKNIEAKKIGWFIRLNLSFKNMSVQIFISKNQANQIIAALQTIVKS